MKRFLVVAVLSVGWLLGSGAIAATTAEASVCGAGATQISTGKINGRSFAVCLPTNGLVRKTFLVPLS